MSIIVCIANRSMSCGMHGCNIPLLDVMSIRGRNEREFRTIVNNNKLHAERWHACTELKLSGAQPSYVVIAVYNDVCMSVEYEDA